MKRYVILISIVAALCSCDKIYDNITNMVDEEIVYPTGYKQEHVVARQGNQRVEIDLYSSRVSAKEMARVLPKAKKTVVEYDNKRLIFDSVCSWVNVPNLIIPNSYRFVIYTEDEWGDKSKPVEIRQKPFTDADREALVFATSFTSSVEMGVINVALAPSLYTIYSIEYSYKDKTDAIKTGVSVNNIFTVNDMKEKANTAVDMTFKIVPKDALDTLWLNSSINIQTISQAELDEYFNETRMFPDPIYGKPRALLTGDSTCFVHACYIDYGGEDVAWHKNGRKMNTAYQMRDAFGEPGQFNDATGCRVGFDGGNWGYADWFKINGVLVPGGERFIGAAQPGDWMCYTIEVKDAGMYQIDHRYASGSWTSAGTYTIDRLDHFGKFQLENTGGWGAPGRWKSMVKPVYLSAGKHKLKFTMVDAESAVAGIRFTKVD
ncbi:hypothetical protein FACS189464_2470 [Bacteroidia bacterium]|nr:hypothetical protein FACS189464_2470 [Bacteroidia bacterium]